MQAASANRLPAAKSVQKRGGRHGQPSQRGAGQDRKSTRGAQGGHRTRETGAHLYICQKIKLCPTIHSFTKFCVSSHSAVKSEKALVHTVFIELCSERMKRAEFTRLKRA